MPVDVVDRLMTGDRPDPILILCKSAGYSWPTAREVIVQGSASLGSRGSKAVAHRRGVCEFRQAVGIDRQARGAVLANGARQPARGKLNSSATFS